MNCTCQQLEWNNNMAPEKWLYISIGVMFAFLFGGMAFSEWHKMDCRLSLGQSGRPILEINEICK